MKAVSQAKLMQAKVAARNVEAFGDTTNFKIAVNDDEISSKTSHDGHMMVIHMVVFSYAPCICALHVTAADGRQQQSNSSFQLPLQKAQQLSLSDSSISSQTHAVQICS